MCITWFEKLNYIQQAVEADDSPSFLESLDEYAAEAAYLRLLKETAETSYSSQKLPASV